MTVELRELVRQADQWLLRTTGYGLPLDYVCQNLHTSDPQNLHLAMPKGPGFSRHPSPRTVPLNPDSPVFGKYLLLDDLDHDDYLVLYQCTSRDELAREICGPAGICNSFVGFQVAFEGGVLLPFRVHYTDLQGRRKLFDKRSPEQVPEDWDCVTDKYRDVELLWLED